MPSPSDRAAELIATLELAPHPEGGHYREIHRSTCAVRTADGRERDALTSIHFLLASGEVSRWHRVASDEAWHFHEGSPLELFVADPGFETIERLLLGPVGDGIRPTHVVPANHWQAARPLGEYTLVGCTVAPGFDFADFEMLADHAEAANTLQQRWPEWMKLV